MAGRARREAVMRWTKLLLVIAFAALSLGGSFECRGSNHGGHDDDDDGRATVSN
jgi:hypothetical protein